MSDTKTVTIRVPAETYEQIRSVCGELGEAFNFNQFVNHSIQSTLDIIDHDEEQIPVPRFAMMARFMKNYKDSPLIYQLWSRIRVAQKTEVQDPDRSNCDEQTGTPLVPFLVFLAFLSALFSSDLLVRELGTNLSVVAQNTFIYGVQIGVWLSAALLLNRLIEYFSGTVL